MNREELQELLSGEVGWVWVETCVSQMGGMRTMRGSKLPVKLNREVVDALVSALAPEPAPETAPEPFVPGTAEPCPECGCTLGKGWHREECSRIFPAPQPAPEPVDAEAKAHAARVLCTPNNPPLFEAEPVEPEVGDIVPRLLEACTGHPHAKIPWPHRVLHDAAEAISDLRGKLEDAPEPVEPVAQPKNWVRPPEPKVKCLWYEGEEVATLKSASAVLRWGRAGWDRVADAIARAEKAEAENANLRAKLEKAEAERDTAQENHREVLGRLIKAVVRVAGLEEELEAAQARVAELEAKERGARGRAATLAERLATTTAALNTATNALEDLAKDEGSRIAAARREERERWVKPLADLLGYAERNTCIHEETKRLGFIWTCCTACGRKWADDEGGMPEYEEPAEITAAREVLEGGEA